MPGGRPMSHGSCPKRPQAIAFSGKRMVLMDMTWADQRSRLYATPHVSIVTSIVLVFRKCSSPTSHPKALQLDTQAPARRPVQRGPEGGSGWKAQQGGFSLGGFGPVIKRRPGDPDGTRPRQGICWPKNQAAGCGRALSGRSWRPRGSPEAQAT